MHNRPKRNGFGRSTASYVEQNLLGRQKSLSRLLLLPLQLQSVSKILRPHIEQMPAEKNSINKLKNESGTSFDI